MPTVCRPPAIQSFVVLGICYPLGFWEVHLLKYCTRSPVVNYEKAPSGTAENRRERVLSIGTRRLKRRDPLIVVSSS